jgi:hypothetical protein
MEGGENMTDSGFGSRCELMLDVTFQTLRSDPELKLCEGLRLIDATRTAISRLAPASLNHFDREVLPRMRTALMERFGVSELPAGPVN